MSFDSEFNYSPVLDYYNKRILDLSGEIGNSQAKLDAYACIDANACYLINNDVDYHTRKINYLTNSSNKIANIINEINIVQNLDGNDKQILMDFYTSQIQNLDYASPLISKILFMRMMAGQTANLVNSINESLNGNLDPMCLKVFNKSIIRTYTPKQFTTGFSGPIQNAYVQSLNV